MFVYIHIYMMNLDWRLNLASHSLANTTREIFNSQFSAFGIWDVRDRARLVWLKKVQGVRQIARLKQNVFIFQFLYNTKILRENHVYLFVIWLVQWWKLDCIYIFTQRMIDLHRLKRNMNDGRIVFLTSLLIALIWNILLLFFSDKG